MKPYCGKEFIVVKIVHDKDLPDEPIYFLDYLSCTHAGFNVDDSPHGWFFPATLPHDPQNRIPPSSLTFDDLLQGV